MALTKVTTGTISDGAIESLKGRNLIINGAMQVSQRGTSATGITASGYKTIDRWYTTLETAGTWTQTQDSGAVGTAGFGYSLKNDCTTADASLAAGDRMMMSYRFEGLNCQHLKKGTASAESLTISFWVNATKTGTYVLELYDHDNSRHICSSYTVSVTNTWEKKTITFAGDTTGALDNDNAKSLELHWYMAAGTNYTSGTLATSWASAVSANRAVGQVNSADSTSNNFSLAGVQMELGSVATPFEYETFGETLAKCQRYYTKIASGNNKVIALGGAYSGTNAFFVYDPKVTFRATPSIDIVSATNYYHLIGANGGDSVDDFFIEAQTTNEVVRMANNTDFSGTANAVYFAMTNDASSYIGLDAEL